MKEQGVVKGKKIRTYWPWLVLLLIILLTAAMRIRLLPVPLERDEGEYAYAGQLILDRIPPYEQVYNMKMPGIYVVYAAILAVFGQTLIAIHLALMLVNAATILLVFLICRKEAPPTVTPTPTVPDIITLGITPQDAVVLTWALNSAVDINLALRSARDVPQVPTTSVTLQYMIETYNITVPPRLPYSLEPSIRERGIGGELPTVTPLP